MPLADPMSVLTAALAALLLAAGWRIRRTGVLHELGKAETLPLRGLLALLVVLGHLNNRTGHAIPGLNVFGWETSAVAVFFFLSGYGLWKSHMADSGYWRGFLLRAFPKILLPVLILAAANWTFQALSGGKFHGLHHVWYVKCLLLFYAISFVAFRFVPRHALSLIALAVLSYWFSMRFLYGSKSYWWVTCFAFPMGFLFSAGEARIRQFVTRRPVTSCLTLAAALVAVSAPLCIPAARAMGIAELLYLVLGPALALCLYAFNGLARFGALCFLGTCSYEVYLVHGIFEYGFLGNGWSSSAYVAAVLGATLVAAVPFHWIDVKALDFLRRRRQSR